ncbi:hypothetical protein GLW20_01075 [Virgibacillus halodenitrificans]|nr:hypothetical protein [Virgibacillus halodenitrificans]
MLNYRDKLHEELKHLQTFNRRSVMISTTAKHALDFRILPRRILNNMAISCFMINNEELLIETLSFFDGKVDHIFIDIEQKQSINLYETARMQVKYSHLNTVKPNDSTLESADLLIRNQFNDELYNKVVIVIGTGNLASKLAMRLAERQASVYMLGRNEKKTKAIITGLNLILPKYSRSIKQYNDLCFDDNLDLVVSFLSGQFAEEDKILPFIKQQTVVIDGGINNFSGNFIQQMLDQDTNIIRLDTRIALPYQMLLQDSYTQSFFGEILGENQINDVMIVSGGFVSSEGAVIVDNIKRPNQIIGIADGKGGVKENEQLNRADRYRIHKIEQEISKKY